jgi:hypothetical protein
MNDKKGFCYDIFKNLAFWSHNDSIAYNPCSFYDGFIDHDIPPNHVWFGPEHKKIIKLVEENQTVPGCHRCYKEEQNGRVSRRQSSAIHYQDFLNSTDISQSDGPEGLDYSVGNLCNLKCIICGPNNSSSWISDYQKIYPKKDISHYLFKKNQKIEITDSSFLKNIKSIHFHGGGEPLMSDAHINLIKQVEKVKGLQDVRIFYNTNATQIVTDEVLSLWERCKLVEIYFSIDDIGHRFEYQRTGAKWSQIVKNIRWFEDNMPHNHMFNINCVWGYLNLFYLDELYRWHQETLPANRYGDPCKLLFQKAIGVFEIDYLSSTTISSLQKKFAKNDKLLSLLSGIEISDRPHSKFWKNINAIDTVRGNDFRKICPEWSALL